MTLLYLSPHTRRSRKLAIGLLIVLLVTLILKPLKWMRGISMHLVEQNGTDEDVEAMGGRCSDTLSWKTAIKALSLAPLRTLASNSRKAPSILLVSVTDIEVRVVLRAFPRAFKTVIQNRTYYALGVVGGTRTYLVQATGLGPTGVRPCIEDGIRVLAPQALILVGIAFGLRADRQQIGDVLLSRQIQDYDPQRWGVGPNQEVVIQSRGNRMVATEWLLDRFIAGKYTWTGTASIWTGLLLSGSLLIDHPGARDRLLQLAPEALGGEMEGATLFDSAYRHHVGWIVVKAISDQADGKKQQHEREHQQLAAENAARFVFHVIRQPDFLPKA